MRFSSGALVHLAEFVNTIQNPFNSLQVDTSQSPSSRNPLWLDKMKKHRSSTTTLLSALDYVPDLLGKAFYGNHSFLSEFGDNYDKELVDEEVLARLSQLADSFSERTTSVAFAGIAAHDVSDRMLATFLGNVLQKEVLPPKSVWLIERDNACQAELAVLHSSELNPGIYKSSEDCPCRFENIIEFFRPELKEIISALFETPHLAIETLASLLMERRAVKLSAECKTHGRVCKLKQCHRHSAGSVCTPFSSQGLQQGLGDVSVIYLLAWKLGNKYIQSSAVHLFTSHITSCVYVSVHSSAT